MESIFPVVLQAVPGRDHRVYAYMNDGTVRCMDMKPLIAKGGVFAPLIDRNIFEGKLTVLNDTVAWDMTGRRDPEQCIDIDPFTLQSMPVAEDPIRVLS